MEDLSDDDINYIEKTWQHDYTNSGMLGDEDLRTIARSFRTNSNRPVNFLDARCKDGYNSNEIRKYCIENLNLFGLEKDTSAANSAKEKGCFTKIA